MGRWFTLHPSVSRESHSLHRQVHEDTYHMQQGLQERVQNCNRIRAGQGSLYLLKVQRQQLEEKLKQAEAWLLQLGKFARLVNYMICQNLVTILEDEISSFVANVLQVRWWVEVRRHQGSHGGYEY